MKELTSLFFVAILIILISNMVLAYETYEITDEEFEEGYTQKLQKEDRVVFPLNGQDYEIVIVSFSKDTARISATESNPQSLWLDDEYIPDEVRFEMDFDEYYDVFVKLNEIIFTFEEKSAGITLKKVHDKIPNGTLLPYICAKFYRCPSGERVRYTEFRGSGCGGTSNPFSLCDEFIDSEREACASSYYDCPDGSAHFGYCTVTGRDGSVDYGCDCMENPEELCTASDLEDLEVVEEGGTQKPDSCPQIAIPRCPEGSELESEKDPEGCALGHKCVRKLSNGRNSEIKIMPETASKNAIERLGELNFTVELKEVGKGDDAKSIYELTGEKNGRFLGIFKIQARVQAQVDAETGEVISVKKPWWSFLATGI
jgi:hypothetical protein